MSDYKEACCVVSRVDSVPWISPPYLSENFPMLIGDFMNVALFGVLCVQVSVYFEVFCKDRLWSRCLVACIFIMEVIQTVLVMIDGIRVFGNGWGDKQALDGVGLVWFSVPLMTAIISLTVQIFFAGGYGCSVKHFGFRQPWCVHRTMHGGIWAGIRAHQVNNFMQLQVQVFSTTAVWLGGSATADLIIVGSLVFYIHKSQPDGLASNPMYVKIIRLIVESGSLCAVVAVMVLALYLGYRHFNYHLAPSIALSKLYSNSLLVILNSRVFLRRIPLLESSDGMNTFSLLDTPSMDARLRNMAAVDRTQRVPVSSPLFTYLRRG
ncbi:hypothetical protein BDZ89DRAFT_1133439 [Hymenopellis radicata]|nr:hypothetical protein BDZ89DRAFT_1133439 [Hymenopellis radicata]